MKYTFDDIENGQIADGYTVIEIVDGEAEIDPFDSAARQLAESRGGKPAIEKQAPKRAATKKEEVKADGSSSTV